MSRQNQSGQEPAVRLQAVSKTFPSAASWVSVLDGVSLTIPVGEFTAILGPSGSGKSTLLAIIAGLEPPSAGEVVVFGEPVHKLTESERCRLRRERVGFVFQSFQLLGNLTARENVQLPLEIAGHTSPRSHAEELVQAVGLSGRSHHYPSQLSGGEQQRVAIARAFATNPSLLLADEPTGNLDAATGAAILDLLLGLRDNFGTTLLLVTHSEAISARADRRVHLRAGRIPGDGGGV